MIVRLTYLSSLVAALAGLAVTDHRWRLVIWQRPKAAAVALVVGVAGFSLWDAAGIALGVFFAGRSDYTTGWFLGPEYPVEELFFLTLLCYQTLILWEVCGRCVVRWRSR